MSKSPTSRKIRPLQLAAIIFFTVSGGPYGLEPLLQYAGDHAALLMLVVVPFLWDIPAILTVLELNSMMPVTGGYYQWVKHALGIHWAFLEGIWTWVYTFVDLAIYPVLFVQYTSYLFPAMEAYKIPLCLLIIWASAAINITGILQVGRISSVLSVLVILPFLAMFVIFFSRHNLMPVPRPSLHSVGPSTFGLALYTVMWNFFGWDSTTTYAEEVEHPIRSYLKAVSIAFVAVIVVYLLVTLVGIRSGIDHATLAREGYPALGTLAGGHWLGTLIACGGMASSIGLYNANVLSVSRVPKVMADDRLLPRWLSLMHPRFDTPYVSVIVCSAIVSVMVLWTFADLLVIDVTVYSAGLFLEYISLVKLRITEPETTRPFRVPLPITGLILMIGLPVLVYTVALGSICISSGTAIYPAVFAVVLLCIPEIIWRIMVWKRPYLSDPNP